MLGNATTPLKQYGILPWSALTDYPVNGLVMGLDGAIYQAVQPSGPGNGGAQDTSLTAFWKAVVGAARFRNLITTSGTYTYPKTGWYQREVLGGGGGGGSGNVIGGFFGGELEEPAARIPLI